MLAALSVQVRGIAGVYQVYELSGSAFQLGVTSFLQALPFVLFGLFAGVIADSFDRKKLLLLSFLLQVVPGLLLALLTLSGTVRVWHIYTLGFIGAAVEVFSWPARAAMVPRLVPPPVLMNAVAINTMIIQTSFLAGPAIGGFLIDRSGLVATYLIGAMAFVPAALAILLVRTPGAPEGGRRAIGLRSLWEGVEFIWIQRIVLSLFLLDFGVTLVGFYRPLLPVLAADLFRVGATGLGILYAAPSIGSLLGSMAVLAAGDARRKGVLVIVAALCFAGGLALLGVSRWFWLSAAAAVLLGFTDSISVAVRRTVVQLLAPDAMLGRASGLMVVFAQATNGLGALLAGAAAQAIGAPTALLAGSAACVVIVFGISRAIPQLWAYRS